MARGGGSRRGSSQVQGRGRANTGGIRKNTRTWRAPHRYGQNAEESSPQPERVETQTREDESEEIEASEARNSPPSGPTSTISAYGSGTLNSLCSEMPVVQNLNDPRPNTQTPSLTNEGITLDNMRELLQSYENDIVDQVVLRLQSRNPAASPSANQAIPVAQDPSHQVPTMDPGFLRITELENQLARLRAERDYAQGGPPASTQLEQSTLTQIAENRFKPTNIYQLLASEKERAELQRTISIGGVEFEQAERDGKESEYRMSSFFKAWAAYSGILVKLAPYGLQGKLATALFIYTMNLYDLLEKYTWEGVKGYHFQFHRKRVASGKSIYLPSEWQQLDSELIASKCFAQPIVRNAWPQSTSRTAPSSRRFSELPIQESLFANSYSTTERCPIAPCNYPTKWTGALHRTTCYQRPSLLELEL